MNHNDKEANNIKKALESFSRMENGVQASDAVITYASEDTLYSRSADGKIEKLKDIEKNVKVTKQVYKVRANKKNTNICGA